MDARILLANPLNVMATTVFAALLLSSLLLIPQNQGAIAQEAFPDFATYTNSEYGLTLSYPETWTVEEDNTYLDSEYDIVGFFSPAADETDTIYEYVSIAVIPGVTSGTSLDEIAESTIAVFEESVDEFHLLESASTTLGSNTARKIVYTGSFLGFDAKAMTILAVENQSLYAFKFFATEQHYSMVLPLVNEITSSVKIEVVQGGSPVPAELIKFTNSTYGIEISYPENWSIVEDTLFSDEPIPNFINIVLIESGSSPLEVPVYFHVGIERIPRSLSLDEYTKATLQYLEDGEVEFELIESTDSTLLGHDAHKIVYLATFVVDGIGSKVKLMQVWTVDSGFAYVLTYAAAEGTYDKYFETVKSMLGSFKIGSPPGPSNVITNQYLPYDNEELAISLDIPDNWEQFAADQSVRFRTPTYGGGINIFKWDGAGLFTLDQLTERTLEEFRKKISLFTLLESNSTTLSGLPAHKIIYTGLSDPFDNGKVFMYKEMVIWTLSDARAYGVSYAIFEEDYSTFLPVAQKMIDSLQIDTSDSPKVLNGRFIEPSSKLEIVLPEGWKGVQNPRLSVGESPYTSGIFVVPEGLDLTRIMNGASSDFYAMFILTGNLEELITASDDDDSCKLSSDMTVDFVSPGLKAFILESDCEFLFLKDAVTVKKVKSYTLANTDGAVVFLIFYANSASTYDDHIAEFEESVKTVELDNPLDISDSAAFYENEAISKHNYKVSSETVTINGADYGLHIATNSTLSGFNLNQERKTISFSVDGREGTFGATDIEISKVLDGPYSIIIDGQPAEDVSLVVDRTTNVTFMTVGYSHSVHEITIIGTNVVPEFPLGIVVVVFASVVAAGFILERKQSLF